MAAKATGSLLFVDDVTVDKCETDWPVLHGSGGQLLHVYCKSKHVLKAKGFTAPPKQAGPEDCCRKSSEKETQYPSMPIGSDSRKSTYNHLLKMTITFSIMFFISVINVPPKICVCV